MKTPITISCLVLFILLIHVGCKKNNPIDIAVEENPAIENVKAIKVAATFSLAEGGVVMTTFPDTLKRAQELLAKVFSSKEFRDSMYTHNYSDSSYSKSTSGCFNKVYDNVTGKVPGSAVYANLLANLDITLAITIKDNGTNTSTLGSAAACANRITTYDYWLTANQNLSYRLARHIAHEFTHIRGYRHDSNVSDGFTWGSSTNKDPAYGVGSVVGNILTRWNKIGLVKL